MGSEYKRILLIINENRYSEDKLIETIQGLEKPGFIDGIWCAFYEYEEIWNEKLEDFDGERKIDIEYLKLYQ